MSRHWTLSPDRCFHADPAQRDMARALYTQVRDLPLVSPHGHVDPALLAAPHPAFGTPADLLIIPDHYVFRMLYSQGVTMEDLGVPARDGTPVEQDHRRIWQRFAEHFHLFAGTPSGLWLADELTGVFGIDEQLDGESAQRIYDQIAARLADPAYSPRALFDRFGIEHLSTTDPAGSRLEIHAALRTEPWGQRIHPTFRPDAVVNLLTPGWRTHLAQLESASGITMTGYDLFIRALEERRTAFKQMGATATDHAARTPYTARLPEEQARTIFQRALHGEITDEDAARFTAHMLMEMARMSCEDGLVMQLHAGSLRDHHQRLYQRFGPDMGADIPVATEWTHNLRPVLNAHGADPRFRLILFTLDPTTFSRELAPLAGHYPAVLLGPPWWFFDSVLGIRHFLDSVVETAGFYNLAGFNDDTRAFCSIPARHDVWRRVTCDWLAGQVIEGLIEEQQAGILARELAYGLAKRAYRLG